MNIFKYIPNTIIQFVKIYFTAIIFFTFFRLILFFTEIGRITDSTGINDILYAFLMGLRFDIVISGYILILPYILLIVFSFFKTNFKIINKIAFNFISTLFSLAFLVCAIDIPYFNQFFSRFSVTAFEWINNKMFIFKMVIEEPRYWLILIPLFFLNYLFIKILKKIFLHFPNSSTKTSPLYIIFSLLFLGLIFLGIRGRIDEKSPILIGTAYFSNNAFLNQLGLNPNFTLMRSYLDSRNEENKSIKLIDDKVALANVQKYFNIKNPDKNLPLLRKINFENNNSTKPNVVVIIMESMSAAKMERHGNKNHLTHFLDSISEKGYYFENAYTSGNHTFNGIFSTLFSFPALFRQHPMNESTILKYHGIASTLKAKGYSTIYFTTHDGQFDNVEGFLKANDFENVISKPNYPADKVETTLGVPDDFMFEFSIPILNKLNDKKKPFFATFMTASDHGPFYIPEYFKPTNSDTRNGIVEYADYSLKKFIELSSKQKWFKNTLFVFIADHGAPIDGLYDMSLDYNHSPLIFFAPDIIKDYKTFSCMAGQIDIFPSIMGLLKIPYENNTLGIDLFNENRPCIYFNGDDKYGIIDNDWFLIVKNDNTKSLYKYRNRDTHNYAEEKKDIVEKMNVYAQSNMQTFQYITKNNKQ